MNNPQDQSCSSEMVYDRMAGLRPGRAAALVLSAFLYLGLALGGASGWAEEPRQKLLVAQDGSGTHGSIQSAIDAAGSGALVEIRPGVYRESLTVQKRVEIRGSAWNEVTLTAPAEGYSMPLIRVRETTDVFISGLKVTLPAKGNKDRLLPFGLIEFEGAEGIIFDAAVVGGPGNGIVIKNGSQTIVSNCLVAALWNTGVAIGGRADVANRASMVDSEIRNCYHRGITIHSAGKVEVERCRISGSAWHGIRYDDCSPRIVGCFIGGNARSGIYASGQTAAEIRDNVFWRNGLSAWFQNRDSIEQNTFVSPRRAGIDLIGESRPMIRSNFFQGNKVAIAQGTTQGIKPESMPALPQLAIRKNVFSGNDAVWRGFAEQTPSIARVEGSILTEAGNVDSDLRIQTIPTDFRLPKDFRSAFPGIGSSAPFVMRSKWPLQPEERAIIPDGEDRDYKLWKSGD